MEWDRRLVWSSSKSTFPDAFYGLLNRWTGEILVTFHLACRLCRILKMHIILFFFFFKIFCPSWHNGKIVRPEIKWRNIWNLSWNGFVLRINWVGRFPSSTRWGELHCQIIFFFLSKVEQCAINHRLSLLLNSNVLDSLCLRLPQGA